jgi:hypothetical protein
LPSQIDAIKQIKRLVLFTALLSGFQSQSSQCKSIETDKAKPGLMPATKLTQTHFFFGDTNTFCRPDAVRIDNLGPMHFSVVAKAPKWTVTVFRDDDKSCFVETIHSLEVNGLMNDYVMHRQDHAKYQDQKPGEIIVNNFKVKQVSGKSEYIAYLPIDKVASPEVERILYAAYKIPTNNGIPLKFIRTRRKIDWLTSIPVTNEASVYFSTKKIESAKVPKTYFDAPTGYRVRNTVQEVMVSDANRNASGDMVELFEIGKNAKAKKDAR